MVKGYVVIKQYDDDCSYLQTVTNKQTEALGQILKDILKETGSRNSTTFSITYEYDSVNDDYFRLYLNAQPTENDAELKTTYTVYFDHEKEDDEEDEY